MNPEALIVMSDHDFTIAVKSRLGKDHLWREMIQPDIRGRTYATLNRMLDSMDEQIRRYANTKDADWLSRVTNLRNAVLARLAVLEQIGTPLSSTAEGKMWKAFAADLARIIQDINPFLLEDVRAPRGGINALEWIEARDCKADS